jgi:hypothetical protein
MRFGPLSGEWQWRHARTQLNGQPAVGSYAWYEPEGSHLPFAMDVFTIEGDRIKEITSFINRSTKSRELESYLRFPEEPIEGPFAHVFEQTGLPDRIDR